MHSHYRRGSDCGWCDCPRYQRPGPLLALLRWYTAQNFQPPRSGFA